MWHLSEERYQARLQKIQKRNQTIEYRNKLKEEKNKHKKQLRLPSTSKLILIGAVLLCLEIILYCEYAMMYFGNTEAMYALIGMPATLAPVIWGYYSKAKAENTANGIVYETAMKKLQNEENEEDAKG